MKMLKVGNRIINAGLIAWAERVANGGVVVHFPVPKATSVPGVT